MKIYALESENEEFEGLVNQLGERVSIDLFEDFDSLITSIEEDCEAILLDFDIEQRKKEKMLKKIKKEYSDIKIFLLSNNLDPKKIAKHQKSRTGAHLYFQTPIEDEILDAMIEPFFSEWDEETAQLAIEGEKLVEEHLEEKKVSGNAEKISQQIDGALSSVFFEDYAEEDKIAQKKKQDELEKIQLDQGETAGTMSGIDLAVDMDDIALDDDTIDEIKMDSADDEVEELEELSLDDEPVEMSAEDNSADELEELSLDDEDENWEDNNELSLDDDLDEAEPVLPNEEDLTFPDLGEVVAKVNEESADEMSLDDGGVEEMSLDDGGMEEMSLDDGGVEEMSLDDGGVEEMSLDDGGVEEMSLDDGGVEELSLDDGGDELSLDEDSAPAAEASGAEEIDLGGGDELGLEELSLGEEEAPAQESAGDDLAIDLGGDSEELAELSLGEEEPAAAVENDSVDELALSLDDDSVDDLSFNLGDESAGADEAASADEAPSLSLSEDEMTSPSQAFRLDETQVKPADEPVGEADSGVSLSSSSESDSAGEMNTGMNVIEGLDADLGSDEDVDELTRPALSLSDTDEGLTPGSLVEDETSAGGLDVQIKNDYEPEGQEDIGDLLAQGGSNAPEPIKEVASIDQIGNIGDEDLDLTETGVTIAGVAMPTDIKEKLQQELAGEKVEKAEVAKNEQTSIAIDQELSSIDLPSELPSFNTTVVAKLDEIDDLLANDAPLVEDQNNDHTLAAANPESDTGVYEDPDYDEDATVVKKISIPPKDDTPDHEATRVFKVPDNLKQEHRDYVKSHDEELIRLGETIKNLREDRESMLSKITELEEKRDNFDRDFMGLKAELDEKKIEIAVIKKRMEKQIDDLRFQLDITLDKKEFLSKQNEDFGREIETLTRQKKLDVNKIRSRERELEEKLEMLRRDAEIQMRNRDQKILELKRRIDTLEFDIESAHMKERQSTTHQVDLEDKMSRVIKTLRGAIGQLEEDYDYERRKSKIKDNLDV